MNPVAFVHVEHAGEHVTLSGIVLTRLLSFELFREALGVSSRAEAAMVCHDRWTDLADTLAALPDPAEVLSFVGRTELRPGVEVSCGFLAIGRGESPESARERCVSASRALWTAMTSTLEFGECDWIRDEGALADLVGRIHTGRGVELARRKKPIEVTPKIQEQVSVGFKRVDARVPTSGSRTDDQDSGPSAISHVFPWMPSDDPWWRLLEALFVEPGDPLLLAHVVGLRQAPESALEQARETFGRCQALSHPVASKEISGAALQRIAILEGPVLNARVFLIGLETPQPALIATVESSIDDATVRIDQPGVQTMFRGGTVLRPSAGEDVLRPLDDAPIEALFGPREAAAFLRTPMPAIEDLPGLTMKRARTARLTGVPGADCPLGINAHAGERIPISLDTPMRSRHAYVVGQTGTGKSTLLLHMILHDIHAGRGVCVLDPHGTLVQAILERFPEWRSDDLVLFDVEDDERPIGFNVLRVETDDPRRYRAVRDLVIDELYAYIDQVYDMRQAGGPIFETYFRGLLGLLMGTKPPDPESIPNLAIFRSLFTKKSLRTRLREVAESQDPPLAEFVQEIDKAGGEATLANVAPYVTSKLNRFTFDTVLRNILCQDRVLDLDHIVRERKVLLVHTARGRVGDYPAGLLAGQIVSRLRRSIMSVSEPGNVSPFFLYADEFQLFATERFGELLAEARKFGLAITIAHQFAAQLDPKLLSAVLGNVGSVISLRVGGQDAERLAPVMQPVFAARDLISLPNFRACVRSFGTLGYTPFSLELEPPPEARDPDLAARLRERSRQAFGRPREEVEREFLQGYCRFAGIELPTASEPTEEAGKTETVRAGASPSDESGDR